MKNTEKDIEKNNRVSALSDDELECVNGGTNTVTGDDEIITGGLLANLADVMLGGKS